jgi:hypothetical protein
MKKLAALFVLGLMAAPVPEQEPEKPAVEPAVERYPQTPSARVVRFFALATEKPDLAAASAALVPLDASVLYGPRRSPTRPGSSFLALRAPVDATSRDLTKALAKAGAPARELACVVFDGHTPDSGVGAAWREDTLAMFRSVSWVDSAGPWTQLYLEDAPSAREAEAMRARYQMMWEQDMDIGRLANDRFAWTLNATPDEKTGARLTKAVRKLPGVVEVALVGAELRVTVELLAVRPSGDSGPLPKNDDSDLEGRTAPRVSWPTHALHALLVSEGLLAPAAGEAPK